MTIKGILGCKQQNGFQAECLKMSKLWKSSGKRVKATKSYREGHSLQVRAQYFEKLRWWRSLQAGPLSWNVKFPTPILWPPVFHHALTELKTSKVTTVWRPTARWCMDGWQEQYQLFHDMCIIRCRLCKTLLEQLNC